MACMKKHYLISEYFSEEDWEIMAALKDLSVEEDYKVMDGFKIIFKFNENAFFTSDSLWKSYAWDKDTESYKTQSSPVQWKEGKNLPQNNKDFKQKEMDGTLGPDDSYHWFGDFEEQPEEGEDEIAEVIRDEIWEDPLKIYQAESEEEDEEETVTEQA